MEPISATASVLTLLGAVGGSCKFLFDFLLDLSEAPHDIQAQNKKLGCLYETLTALVQMYSQLPSDFQFHPHLRGKLLEFANDLGKMRARIEVKSTTMSKGRVLKVQESFKWLFFDRQLKKLLNSLDHWDIVLSQATIASQVALCLQIKTDTSTILAMSKQDCRGHQSSTLGPPCGKIDQSSVVHQPHVNSVKSQDRTDMDNALRTSGLFYQPSRLANYLATIEEPAGGQYQYWCQIHLSILQVHVHTGPLVVRRWSRSGREQYVVLSAREGYSVSMSFESLNFVQRKLLLNIFAQYNGLSPFGFSLRLSLRVSGLFDFDGPYHAAIGLGDKGYLRLKLSERSLRPYDSTLNGDTLLHLAAGHSQSDIITMLIDEGADVNATNNKGETPLHVCVKRGCDYESASKLLANGADLHRQDKNGHTALHMFYNELIGQIIKYHQGDLDLSLQDGRGMTIMHWACWTRKSTPQDIITNSRLLATPSKRIGAYSPLDTLENHGKSMLHFAVERGNARLIDFLLSTAQGQTMSAADFSGCNLLHYSVASSCVELIDYFLQKGFDLDSTDYQSRTVLHHAAMRGNSPAVKKLLELGTRHQLALRDRDGHTPLQLAMVSGSMSVVEYLQSMCLLDEPEALNRKGHVAQGPPLTQKIHVTDAEVLKNSLRFIVIICGISLIFMAGFLC